MFLDNGKLLNIQELIKSSYFKIFNSQNSKIIIFSHVGRPKGKIINELFLKPICDDLEIN